MIIMFAPALSCVDADIYFPTDENGKAGIPSPAAFQMAKAVILAQANADIDPACLRIEILDLNAVTESYMMHNAILTKGFEEMTVVAKATVGEFIVKFLMWN